MKRLHSSTLIVCVLIFTACNNAKEERKDPLPAQKVVVEIVKDSEQVQALKYSGTIEAENTAQIGFAVPGIVSSIAVQEGQFVKKGQLLATIDATEYVNALAIADAGLQQAEDMYRRLNELYEKKSLPEKDYIDIKTKVAQARANKSINEKRIRDSRLYAPMSGIISAKMIERGSTAAPGLPAFIIVRTDAVYAKVSVPENEIGAIRRGMKATVDVQTVGETFSGPVSIINPQADPVSRTYFVKALLPNEQQKLLPGMIISFSVNTGKMRRVIAIPAKAIMRDADDITYVFVINDQKKAVQRRITAEEITGTQDVIVSAGLQQGDRLVVEGQNRLRDGSPVAF